MGNAADMPELQEDFAVFFVHRIRDEFPPCHLFRRVNTRRAGIALPLLADLRGFRNDQTGSGALRIISCIERPWLKPRLLAAHARQRRHHNTILQGHITQMHRIKQICHHCFLIFKSSG